MSASSVSSPRKTCVAIIPARGGSERISGKNIMPIAGIPLLAHSILQAQKAIGIDTVYVSTDDDTIAATARAYSAEVIMRPSSLATATNSSESSLLHAVSWLEDTEGYTPEKIVFLQATSPLRRAGDLDQALMAFQKDGVDSLFAATAHSTFYWEESDQGFQPVNYDGKNRPRSQDMSPLWHETGSFYIVKTNILKREQNRLGGKTGLFPIHPWSSHEIDTMSDVPFIEWALTQPVFSSHRPRPQRNNVDLIALDFDGVLTDNSVTTHQDGSETIQCSRSDSLGLESLRHANVPVVVISKEKNPVVAARCAKLSLPCHQGIDDKLTVLRSVAAEYDTTLDKVVYVGNDINDLECLLAVGHPVGVSDSYPEVLRIVKTILSKKGGHGAVRELADMILNDG